MKPETCNLRPVTSKAAALIIVIFAMLLFSILGWTLLNLESGDFEINLRTLNSEQALNIAEAGLQYSLPWLASNSSWRTGNGDSDCNDPGDWLPPHTLNTGQYSLCCRNATVSEQLTATTAVETRGYSPTQANPRAMRQLKILLQLGSFDKVLQAKNLFSWSAAVITSNPGINGDIQAGYYDGDGDANYNEIGVDYASPNLPLGRNGDDKRTVASEPYPSIDMTYYEAAARTPSYNPAGDNTWAPPLTATITNIGIDLESNKIKMDVNPAIFTSPLTQWNNQAIRNISKGSWQNGSWTVIYDTKDTDTVLLDGVVSWAIGDRITLTPKISSLSFDASTYTYTINLTCPVAWSKDEAVRNFNRGSWNYTDWGVIRTIANGNTTFTIRVDDSVDLNVPANRWAAGDWIGEVKRYRDNVVQQTLWYIMADVLFDVRDKQSWESGGNNRNIVFRRTSLVAEGDIGIKGLNRLHFTERPFVYPNLATKNGSITSLDNVGSAGQRDFDDIVYTENGDIIFNYIDARAIFGNNVILDGTVRIRRYDQDLTRLSGYSWGFSSMQWQED